jgi:hypothetical protein
VQASVRMLTLQVRFMQADHCLRRHANAQSYGSLLRLLLTCCGKLELALATASHRSLKSRAATDSGGSELADAAGGSAAYLELVPAGWEAMQAAPGAAAAPSAGGVGLLARLGVLPHPRSRFQAGGARTRRQAQLAARSTSGTGSGSEPRDATDAAATVAPAAYDSSTMELLTTGFGVAGGLRR